MKSNIKITIAVLFVIMSSTLVLASKKVTVLEWMDLVPEGSTLTSVDMIPEWELDFEMAPEQRLSQLKPLDEPKQEVKTAPAPLVSKYNGKIIKIAGYMVPLDFEATKVKQFLLVPYIGACIHVPPPPGNQIILVESKKGVPVIDNYTPIYVQGKLDTGKYATDIAAEIGYHMKLSQVSEYVVEE